MLPHLASPFTYQARAFSNNLRLSSGEGADWGTRGGSREIQFCSDNENMTGRQAGAGSVSCEETRDRSQPGMLSDQKSGCPGQRHCG